MPTRARHHRPADGAKLPRWRRGSRLGGPRAQGSRGARAHADTAGFEIGPASESYPPEQGRPHRTVGNRAMSCGQPSSFADAAASPLAALAAAAKADNSHPHGPEAAATVACQREWRADGVGAVPSRHFRCKVMEEMSLLHLYRCVCKRGIRFGNYITT